MPTRTNELAKEAPEPRSDLAWAGEGNFHGRLADEGRYVICDLPPMRPDHRKVCGASIRNEEHSLRSHYCREHTNKAHARDMFKGEDGDPRPWKCAVACGATHENWAAHYQHIRSVHGFRGKSKRIREGGGVLKSGCTIDKTLKNQIVEPVWVDSEEDDVKEGDDKDKVKLPKAEPYWMGYNNGSQGPPGGAAGGQFTASY
ncbi:hypothetical protein PG994_006828 [Apiospora phragmitis]|uniref:C2H2-type domain-containing protein n=1 Tax=Apiospora phragmitis TaxID=2905665 RepID=A0ABR1VGE0_9PEZI